MVVLTTVAVAQLACSCVVVVLAWRAAAAFKNHHLNIQVALHRELVTLNQRFEGAQGPAAPPPPPSIEERLRARDALRGGPTS